MSKPISYQIAINEAQRERIVRALQLLEAKEGPLSDAPGNENLFFLLECFESLPDIEAGLPGVLHGFCL